VPILLKFEKAHGQSLSVGPFNALVFERETIRTQTGGPVIAKHLSASWSVSGEEFLRLDVEPHVVVTWEGFRGSPSTTGQLHCVDGVAYIDRRMFAVVDRERGDWYLKREGQHHRAFIVQAVA
jgi:hypothetical protein